MTYPLYIERFEELAGLSEDLHLAIGMFDGVHLGHKAVIESAVLSAQRSGRVSGVLTFDPHPSRLFAPENPTCLIVPTDLKKVLLTSLGINIVICKRFDRAFASISAEDFLPELKEALPTLKSIYVGENFRFGKMRAGSVATLIQTGNQLGINVFSAERIKHNGKPISSTRIRKELESGKIENANDLLGYNYRSNGSVVRGEKLGRTLGFPTLNIPWSPECQPKYGVYHVQFRSSAEQPFKPGVANYGIRPTVNQATDRKPVLEIHALTDTTMNYGDSIEVEWLHFIRPEQKFDSVERLKKQIANDCEVARRLSNQNG